MSGKLYWRIKKNGKWTWKPAKVIHVEGTGNRALMYTIEEEEE